MARPRNLRGGRPPEALVQHERLDTDYPHTEWVPPTKRFWFEGEVIVPDWDDVRRNAIRSIEDILLATLPTVDETGLPLPGAIALCEQDMSENPRALSAKRRYARSGDMKLNSMDMIGILRERPGRTIRQLAMELFPKTYALRPVNKESNVRMLLARMRQNEVAISKYDEDGYLRWYPVTTDHPDPDHFIELIARSISLKIGGEWTDQLDLTHDLADLILHNNGRPREAWRDHRGAVRTTADEDPIGLTSPPVLAPKEPDDDRPY